MEGLEQGILNVTRRLEAEVDAQLERLEARPEEELAALRQKRLKEFQERHQKMEEWRKLGHGHYNELPDEKEFFTVAKASSSVVCLFFRGDIELSKVFAMHLKKLAPKHLEAKFCCIDAARAPFLVERLRIKTIPTIALVRDGKTKDYVVGLRDLGGREDFRTEILAARLARGGAIEVEDPDIRPDILKKQNMKIIRGKDDESSDSE
uniref:Putative atp binding protein n=1 Tax=Lutzomyia longipalpis TaxID=7200 RepID=A0A1B0GLG4_LUTLO